MTPPRTAAEAAEPAGRSAASSTAVSMHDFGIALRPDAGRLVARFFVPGKEDLGPGDSRAAGVIDRILALTDDEVAEAMADLDDRFGHHYVALGETFEQHAAWLSPAVEPTPMSASRRRLIGAAFTSEYAIEGAALCNPSIVRHPEQGGDGTAFVMSVRSIGEGHRSSIGFRTGSVTADGAVVVDVPGRWPEISSPTPGVHHRSVLHRKLADLGDDHENAALALDALPAEFEDEQLRKRIYALWEASATRRHTERTVANLRRLADCAYRVEFRAETHISERVLWPHSPTETHGMEDARFVEITDGSAPRYCATYTAFDGANIMQNLLTTEDFRSFEISPMAGRAAIGKGLALFPRQVGGRFVALSRADRETNSVAFSDDLRCWDTSETIQAPVRSWELVQLGNCGSPIETSEGWLVLTHGVGPMRTYSISAILLDLDHPERVIATSDTPILRPGRNQRSGYVPNVVYSCGALALGDQLVLPYGVGDQTISIATLSISELIASMRRVVAG